MEKLFTDYLSTLNPNVVIIVIVIIIFAIWIVFKNRKTILGFFDDLYNRRKNKDILLQTIHDNQAQIKEIVENRIHDREQSLTIQKELMDTQKELSIKQNELSGLVSEIIKSSVTRDEQINNLMVAQREVLGDRINQVEESW